MAQVKKVCVIAGAIWCFLFALMSFYWASGGMIGVKSLGGSIQELALKREPSFVALVWITGILKVAGGAFLLSLLKKWSKETSHILYLVAFGGGILLMLYGLVNMITLFLASIGMISLPLDSFSLKWRLYFWEPYWMVGGTLFILSAIGFEQTVNADSGLSVPE